MPGGRLSYQDREQIAAGLTEGLGYAEIARRLGRPTSTITREVTRNGGPKGYRAGVAHRAAAHRARRRRPVPAPQAVPQIDSYGRDTAAVRAFEERYIAMMVETGLPPMIARVFSALLLADGGHTATELVQRLRVSPASVSKAVRYLEQLEFVSRERDPRTRRERYHIGDDVLYRAWTHASRSQRMWAEAADQGAKVLGTDTPAGARLAEMGLFFGMVAQDIRRSAEHWWQVLAERRRQDGNSERVA